MHPKSKSQHPGAPKPMRFPWRVLVYVLILLYLLGDLFWIGGPLRDWVDSRLPQSEASRSRALEEGWMALVNGVPVPSEDVELAIARRMALTGQDWDSLTTQVRKLERLRALDQVVRERLLLTYSRFSRIDLPDDEQAIEIELQRWRSLLAASGTAGGIDPASPAFADLIRREWRLARWVEARVSSAAAVSDEDVRTWLEQNPAVTQVPTRHRVRHLYLSRHREAGAVREDELQRIGSALAALTPDSEPTWEQMVAEFSEDPATVKTGGQLGWISRDRMPDDFMQAVVQAAATEGEITGPHATALGWHWIVVDETRPARQATFEEMRDEIRAHLESQRRHEEVEILIGMAKNRANIYYYRDVLLADLAETPKAKPQR